MEEEYKLWLAKKEEKRILAGASGLQRVRCIIYKEEYILWRERMRRRIGASKAERKEDEYAE
jgi:hypothetical protein